MDPLTFIIDLLVVLAAGLLAGIVCKQFGVSMLVGYLLAGALIGTGGLRMVGGENQELEYLARTGALLLLFAIGIEFSLEELMRLSRYFFAGGTVQMLLVAVPVALVGLAGGLSWGPTVLVASAAAFSSTVLVFKALAEWGQTASRHGRRAIGILLFQDVALVPLILLVPLLTGGSQNSTTWQYLLLAGQSFFFVVSVIVVRWIVSKWLIPLLAHLRSAELLILFALSLLGGVCLAAFALGLPPAIGAFATGLILSDNRLSKQIDALVLPYRETFAAVFFVTLGTLLRPAAFLAEPLMLAICFVGVLGLKATAAGIALKLIGLDWRTAAGMGLGLAQLGEFSFVLLIEGLSHKVISEAVYNRMLFIALGTVIITPLLLRIGLSWARGGGVEEIVRPRAREERAPIKRALVIGAGLTGRQIVSRLELMGVDVCLADLSPINLYPYEQQGFHTVAGDARDPRVLQRADVTRYTLAVVCIPDDATANEIVRGLRRLNPHLTIIVRCRYISNDRRARKAGADEVVSEEAEASGALLRLCEQSVLAASSQQARER